MSESVSEKGDLRESILRDKPLLVTLTNPSKTIGPLWPEIEWSAGWRLWQMMHEFTGASMQSYLRIFERRSVSNDSRYDWDGIGDKVNGFKDELRGRSRVVFVGYDVLVALGIPKRRYFDFKWRLDYGFTYTAIPYPSSNGYGYRDPIEVALVGVLLADLYVEALQKRRAVIP